MDQCNEENNSVLNAIIKTEAENKDYFYFSRLVLEACSYSLGTRTPWQRSADRHSFYIVHSQSVQCKVTVSTVTVCTVKV